MTQEITMKLQGATYYHWVPCLKGTKCINISMMNGLRIVNDQNKFSLPCSDRCVNLCTLQ